MYGTKLTLLCLLLYLSSRKALKFLCSALSSDSIVLRALTACIFLLCSRNFANYTFRIDRQLSCSYTLSTSQKQTLILTLWTMFMGYNKHYYIILLGLETQFFYDMWGFQLLGRRFLLLVYYCYTYAFEIYDEGGLNYNFVFYNYSNSILIINFSSCLT